MYIQIYRWHRLPHPQKGDIQGQETFLLPPADKQSRNYDTECSNHRPSISTLRSKGWSCRKMKWWATYTNLPVSDLVRLPHPWNGDNQGQEMFLAPSADKQTCNYDTEYSNHHPSLSTLRSMGLSCSKIKWWAIYANLLVSDIDYPILRVEIARARKFF